MVEIDRGLEFPSEDSNGKEERTYPAAAPNHPREGLHQREKKSQGAQLKIRGNGGRIISRRRGRTVVGVQSNHSVQSNLGNGATETIGL